MGGQGQCIASSEHPTRTPVTSTRKHRKNNNVHELCALITRPLSAFLESSLSGKVLGEMLLEVAAYEYLPLLKAADAIRLVILQPGSGTDKIECNFLYTTLSLCPDYEALSYEWGSSEPAKSVLLAGGQKVITPNLWSALFHLRDPERERVLWIDALCINQKNTNERNHQVRQMGNIYRSAKIVIIWLGPVSPDKGEKIRKVFEWLNKCAVIEQKDSRGELVDRHECLRSESSISGTETEYWVEKTPLHLWNDLSEFVCSSTYWSRTWIVQEIVLAPRLMIQCGDSSASWDGLIYLDGGMGPYGSMAPLVTLEIQSSQMMQLQRLRLQKHTLESIIHTTRYSATSDARDKVFSVFHLASDCRPGDIVVDYSMSLAEVYRNVIRFYNSKNKHKQIVSLSSCLQRSIGRSVSLASIRDMLAKDEPIRISGLSERECIYVGHPDRSTRSKMPSKIKDILQKSETDRLAFGDRDIFVDDASSIGFAPPDLKVGDLICDFWGCGIEVFVRVTTAWKAPWCLGANGEMGLSAKLIPRPAGQLWISKKSVRRRNRSHRGKGRDERGEKFRSFWLRFNRILLLCKAYGAWSRGAFNQH